MKHTPGPWRYWITINGARVAGHPADGSKNFVCDVLIPEKAVNYEANARLISAAPDLLQALKQAVEALRSGDPNARMNALRDCPPVVSKATGEPQ